LPRNGADRRVAVIYANFKAQREGLLESGFLRFYGTAELHESGPMREAIFVRLNKREQGTTAPTRASRVLRTRCASTRSHDRVPDRRESSREHP
jgi:hypothetical protein